MSAPLVVDVQCGHCKADGKGVYRTDAECKNCDWRGEAVHSLTHEKHDRRNARCPRCECKTLRMGAYIA